MSTTADDWEEPDDQDAMLDGLLKAAARLLLVLFAACLFASVVLWGCPVSGADDLDAWLKQRAQPTCVYVFTASYCSVCPRQQAVMDWLTKHGWVNARHGSGTKAHFVVVDIERYPDMQQRYSVVALPCMVAVRGDVVAARHDGLLGPDELRALWWKAKGK